MAILCDTRTIEGPHRFDAWSQSLSTSFFPVRVERMDRGAFQARLEYHALGPLDVFHVTAGGCAPVRTAACVAADDPEHLQVHLLRHGRCEVTQDERFSETIARDITLLSSSRPFVVRAGDVHDLVIFSVPRRLLGPHADRLDRWTAVRLAGDGSEAARLGPFLSRVADGLRDGSVEEDDVLLADGVVSLTRALCSSSGRGSSRRPNGPADWLRTRIKRHIEQHLHEVDLSPSTIAAAHFISIRYLHRLFEAEETTLSRWIQRRRLERCCQDLQDPAFANHSIASIATRWGFRNRDALTRLLRTTHGTTPSDLRRRPFTGPDA